MPIKLQVFKARDDSRRLAGALGIELRTDANHASKILFTLSARDRPEAAATARRK